MPNYSQTEQGMRKAFKTPEQEESTLQKIMNYFSQPVEKQVPTPIPTPGPQLDQSFLQGVQQGFSNLSPDERAKRQALLALQRGGF